jgi:pseudaminic acid cytidylyltransferase
MKPIAFIPARGGSKRIPRKNIAPIAGVPALARTILTIHESKVCSDVIVSTDDEEVAQIANKHGASVVSRPSARLSDDLTPTEEVVRNFILGNDFKCADLSILCVYPLSVLMEPEQLQDAAQIQASNPNKFVIAGGLVEPSPLRHTFFLRNQELEIVHPEYNERRSQDLDDVFFDVGLFYLAACDVWLDSTKYWYHNNARVVQIPREDAIDVDTPEDLERLIERFQQKQEIKRLSRK